MKTIVRAFGISALLFAITSNPLFGASVGLVTYTNSLDTRPLVADWASRTYPGAAGDVYTAADLLATVAPSAINQAVADGSPADPPAANNLAVWTSAGGAYLCTRPVNFRCVMAQVRLMNESGTNATDIRVTYDFGIKGVPEADSPGLRAFYNLTGLTNGWVPIPEFSSASPIAGALAADLTLVAPWTHGTNLYIVWVDDNANTVTDPAYTIDNLSVAITSGSVYSPSLAVTITAPTNNARFFAPSVIPLAAVTTLSNGIAQVAFFADGILLGADASNPYTFDWANPPLGQHVLTALVTHEQGSNAQSAPVTIMVHDALGSPFVQLTAPTNGLTVEGPTNLTLSAVINAPAAVTNVEFLSNGVFATNDTTSPYSVTWSAPFGANALTAVATDTNGLRGTSAVVNILINYPPTNTVAPTLAGFTPQAGVTVSNLGNVQITFSERVVNVDAADLLLNGVPAAAVTGDGTNFSFVVATPPTGPVAVTWATNHGITDLGWPAALAFNATAPGATWTFTAVDLSPQYAVVGPSGYTNSFAIQPLARYWASYSRSGGGTDNYTMDTDVNASLAAGLVTNRTVSDAANPPAANANAVWSSTGSYLQTRPTGNRYTVLMGKFLNDSGTNANGIAISYRLTIAAGGSSEDAGKGTQVFYSFTGETNSWINLAALNTTASANGTVAVSTNLALNWTNGANLFLAWVDDNAGASGGGVSDPANQISSFSMQVTGGMPPMFTCFVEAPSNGAVLLAGPSITAAARAVYGMQPYRMEYFLSAGAGNTVFQSMGASTNPPFNVVLGSLPAGTYNLFAVGTDSTSPAVVTNSLTNTFVVANPINVALASPAPGATFDYLTSVSATAAVSGGLPPYSVQYYLDEIATGAPVSTAPYTFDFGQLFVGDHTIRAVATDATGWVSNSVVHTVHITGPLAVMLVPTNGTVFNYGQPLELTALTGGGTGPYEVKFYLNDGLAASLNSSPFTANLGVLSVGTYFCRVQATDSSVPAQHADSTTNLITIIENPLVATLTSPTNGQNVANTLAYSVTATAGVALPLTVSEVDFYYDGALLGSDSTAPYSALVTNRTLGSHTVYAVATDSLGRTSYTATNAMNFIIDPLANDNFTNRIPLIGAVTGVTAANVGATTETGEPTGSGFTVWGATLWWSWVAPASGRVVINTTGSSFNIGQGVYTGAAVNALTQVAFAGNAFGGTVNQVAFNAVQGTEYQIQISGMRGFGPNATTATGSIVFGVQMPPTVAITSPTNNSTFIAATNIFITANATSVLGTVKQVDFFAVNASATLLGTVTNAPYNLTAANMPLGTNTLYAVVTDSAGQTAVSSGVTILMLNSGLTLVLPADGATFGTTNPINISAIGAIPSGTITNVEFYVDGQKLSEDGAAPFSAVWSTVSGGSHRFTATGRDNAGKVYKASPVNIAVAKTVIARGAVWKYLDNGSDQGTAWSAPGFDDSAWASGPSELGYGDSDEATVVNGGTSGTFFITTYFRHTFVVSNLAGYSGVLMNVKRDDGAVVYLNGVEAARFNMNAGTVAYDTLAPNSSDDGTNFYAATVPTSLLVEGTNVVAVEIHQTSTTSSDISFNMDLAGVPHVIRNAFPTIALSTPADGTFAVAPTSITLRAAASDSDGSVTKVEFYDRDTKLGEVTNPPYQLTLTGVQAGVHVLTAVATDDQAGTQTSAPVTFTVYNPSRRWTAFNDQVAGAGTHANATAWNVFGTDGGAPGGEGALRNIETGLALPAKLTTMEIGAFADPICGAPVPGTPAYSLFNGYVDFGSGSSNNAILLNEVSLVVHLFTGLDPQRRYSFRASVVGGVAGSVNRWTQCSIIGADFFSPAHTVGVLTSATEPWLGAEDAAFNSGDNRSGEVVGWDSIAPNADGSFMVLSTQYLGPAPGNTQPGPTAFAPVAVRLEESSDAPWVEITSPSNGYAVEGPTNVVFAASTSSVTGVTNVLFVADGVLMSNDASAPYNFDWANVPFGTHSVYAVAQNTLGALGTSAPIAITITIPPTNTVAPTVATQVPESDSLITNLLSIRVFFSERVVGVNAADLLVNGVPATGVSGSGSNYLFTVTQPPYGPVTVSWAEGHGITDVGWPAALPFDHTGATWQYSLIDRTPPSLIAKNPVAGSILTNLTQVTVTFGEAVAGVNAGDFLVNGIPATELAGSGSSYTFSFAQPASGAVNISWLTNHGITDVASTRNPFNATGPGATWTYTLDAKTILIQSNAMWYFVKGTNEASTPPDAWREFDFEVVNWVNAPAPFFYGDPYSNGVPAYTYLDDMRSNYTSIYLRKTFMVPNASHITNLFLRAQIDDGMVVWINGAEVLRTNVPAGNLAYNAVASSASQDQNGAPYLNFALLDPRLYLVSGVNVIAVHALNESLTNSSDFGFNAQLFTYQSDSEVEAPRIVRRDPPAGYELSLTNITVTFSEPVTGVNATDLLINGIPATGLSSTTNTVFNFTFPQPAFGLVTVSWAGDHGIVDLDLEPKPFDSAAIGASWQYTLLNPNSPYLLTVEPAQDATVVNHLSAIALSFSEAVIGVNAGDLLINGVPATGLSGSGDTYTFTFAQPAYGLVIVTWATNHGIQDLHLPANAFEPDWPGHTWTYLLVDQVAPAISSQNPPASAFVTNLTQLTVTFTEPVSGVNASDILINGQTAASVAGTNASYTFTFAQPNASVINITWAVAHGIRDLATSPNAFNATGPGATWSYSTVDNVTPSLASVIPAPGSGAVSLRQVTLSFNEPVQGVGLSSLTLNGNAARELSGNGSGPYRFTFDEPPTGAVQVALSAAILDLATPPNSYAGSNWTYVLDPNLPPPAFVRGPYLQIQTPTSMVIRWRTTAATDSRVDFGLNADSRTNRIEDAAQVTEHIVTLTNLVPDTRYVYACGTTDGRMLRDTNFFFFTAPPAGTVRPTRIWYISDFGFGNADERSVRDSYPAHVASQKRADVWITGGDNDQISGTEANYTADVFSTNTAYGFMMQTHPLWPTIGNHDYSTGQGVNYYANFSLPAQGEAGGVPSGTEHYYSFDYGNIHFITFDGIDGTYSASTNTSMVQWLHQDLMGNTQQWVIAYWHGPPYTKGSHDSDSTTDTLAWMVQMRENIVPILESYGVDLVLCGHSHVHERTWLINGHYGFSSTFSETNKIDGGDGHLDGSGAYRQRSDGIGTVYVSNGMGGQPRNTSNEQHPAHLVKITDILGSLVIDVNAGQLDCKFINTSGVALDYFTLVKGDAGAPRLFITGGHGPTTVAWPRSATGYALWHGTSLEPAGNWKAVTNGIQTNGSFHQFQFDTTTNGPAGYFRLKQQ